MRKKNLLIIISFLGHVVFGQVSGNINYQNNIQYPERNIQLNIPSKPTIVIKGLANLTADNYVAIFSVSQVGKTTEETNTLIDSRISDALVKLKIKEGFETFIDMISFVPIYEFQTKKKLFSKKTYKEIPKGFEVKKNIHIKYRDPNLLNEIIASLSNSEIYDLVRVDYFSDKIETTKIELINKSKLLIQEKIKNYNQISNSKVDTMEKKVVDGFRIFYPIEMYKSYQAYSNSSFASLNLEENDVLTPIEKSTTSYYQPIINKEFDFVINSTILEPVIQVLYEITLEIDVEKEKKVNSKEYFLVAPNGELKKIGLNN